ncbi:MAG TPA: redoxin domain-containing protein [Planctomycetaceae bacterium]|nr:redoxin domain-containing protein [Planctomycetaceae bacterium]
MIRLLGSASALLFAAHIAFADAPQPADKKAEATKAETKKVEAKKVDVGTQAPEFKIKDSAGKVIDLAELTAKGPVLVRLTCGCSGCDKELAYFQALHEAYKDAGLTSVAVFREPDAKVAAYVKEKKLNMLYAVDAKGEAWNVFETKTMPTNFLIEKGGKIVSVAAGCDPSGLLAKKLSEKVAKTVNKEAVDVQKKVAESEIPKEEPKAKP